MAGTLPSTTDATFADDVLASTTPVLVDFTADWCPPCKMIAPVLDRIAAENADRLRVVALDVDANPQTAQRYNVLGMPTLALFVRGELVTTVVGAQPQQTIMKSLDPYLSAASRQIRAVLRSGCVAQDLTAGVPPRRRPNAGSTQCGTAAGSPRCAAAAATSRAARRRPGPAARRPGRPRAGSPAPMSARRARAGRRSRGRCGDGAGPIAAAVA
jgi:thioredoxin 1